jgi:DNA-directed RNA polymerase beta subunit
VEPGININVNQEDSIIISKGAIDRGLFRVFTYKSISTSDKKHASNDNQTIQLPPEEIRVNRKYCYDKLDKDGIVAVGTEVEEFDVLVGKVRTRITTEDPPTQDVTDCSVICKSNEYGVVDDVCVTTNEKGYKHVKIRIRRNRIPEIGDKFCHVSAQKGIIYSFIVTLITNLYYRHLWNDLPPRRHALQYGNWNITRHYYQCALPPIKDDYQYGNGDVIWEGSCHNR